MTGKDSLFQSLCRWLAWPFYAVGTAIVAVADWLDTDGWWTSR